MQWTEGGTVTEAALDLARDSFVKHARGESLGMPRVAVLITDGEPNNPAEAIAAANALKGKGKGVTVFTVGIVGKQDINEADLREM
ncbi:collagen alpha-1(XIV) chain-like, partial [Aphelenchoides avenae]